MSPFWIVILTVLVVLVSSFITYIAFRFTQDSDSTQWVLEHIHCPIVRILSLLIIVGLIYPTIGHQVDPGFFWQLIFADGNINSLINILFFGSLLMAFIPVIDHPVLSLPIQSCVTVALVFNWQYGMSEDVQLVFLPDLLLVLKIVAYMGLAYFATRNVSIALAEWLDEHLLITGSIRLVGDAVYLTLQLPVIMMYGAYLASQLPQLSIPL